MKSGAKKAVLAEFSQQLQLRLPDYAPITAGLPLRSVFKFEASLRLQLYILIHWHSYDDKYNLEIGWTYDSTLHDLSSCFDSDRAIKRNAAILPLHVIRGIVEDQDYYDLHGIRGQLSQEHSTKLTTVVDSSIRELVEFGLPYLVGVQECKQKDS